jgi:glycerol transport system ATP-binding protein
MAGAQRILHPVDLVLESGTIQTLLGPIRAGKTSLMRIMAGLDRPSAGQILQDGVDVTRVDVRKRGVSMVYQQFINYPSFSVFDNIASPLVVAGRLSRAERTARVEDMAARLGLTPFLRRLPAELSGGQQQRVALARAMVTDSRLLLLDEPLVNLDYKLREDLRAEMKLLFRGSARIVVYATTEPQEALMLGGRTIVLREGRMLQEGGALEVYRAPATLEAARLISDPPMNFLPGSIAAGDGGRIIRLAGGATLPPGPGFEHLPPGDYTFGLHAAHLSLSGAADAAELPVTIELAEISGSETLLHGRYRDTPVLLVEDGVHDVAIGTHLVFRFDRARLYAFDAAGALVRAPRFQPSHPGEGRHGAHSAA